MFGKLRPLMGAIWKAPARALLALGVHPNVMTIIGTAGVLFGALFFFPKGDIWLFWGVMVVTVFVVTDMLDGTMARLGDKSSRLGAFLDSTLDRVADAAIYGALVWSFVDVSRVTAAAALVCLILGFLVPYSRAKAESIGVEAKGGFAQRSDRLVLGLTATGLVGLGLPVGVLTWTLWLLSGLALITFVQRINSVVKAARIDPEWNKDLDIRVEHEPPFMNSLLLAMRVARYAPRSVTRAGAWAGANIGWLRGGKSRVRLEENLHRVTGLGGRELARLSRKGMISAARYYAEVLEMPRISERQADARCRIDDPEPTLSTIHAARGVVVVLSHSGNWDLVGYHATRAIAPVTSVAEVLKPRELFDQFVELRAQVGIRIHGHEGSATYRELLREATAPEERVLALLGDRDLSGSGIHVTMWGHGVRVAPGPAALAKASGKPLIPVIVYYERLHGSARRAARSRWGTVYSFGPVVPVPQGSSADAVAEMSREWSAWMAQAIAEHPQDWHMLQRFGWIE